VSGPPLLGGIIAAGEGSGSARRLRGAKPMVPIAGVPLIESVMGNFRAAGVRSLVVIVTKRSARRGVGARRFTDLDVEFIVKTTPSSLASFREVTARRPGGRMLVSTGGRVVPPDRLRRRFVEAASRAARGGDRARRDAVVADESGARSRWTPAAASSVWAGASGDIVTAGMYLVSERVRTLVPRRGRTAPRVPGLALPGREPAPTRRSSRPS